MKFNYNYFFIYLWREIIMKKENEKIILKDVFFISIFCILSKSGGN